MATFIDKKHEKQQQVVNLLTAYGVTFTPKELTPDSENSFTRATGNSYNLILSDDVDLQGVFEEEKVSGITIIYEMSDNGYKTQKFPVKIIAF